MSERPQQPLQAPPPGPPAHCLGALVVQASQQLSDLVHLELRRAQSELARTGEEAGVGGGMLGGAAVVGVLAAQAVVVAMIAALTLTLPLWAAALIAAAPGRPRGTPRPDRRSRLRRAAGA
ncbi:phage holin family protein [Kitasatospora sp. NPDC098663]|uniref:phage holin family protein n=1 Tax=Kitasatospora sp. NPDC098663 TaxID=3364096 RepID=UPI0037FCB299